MKRGLLSIGGIVLAAVVFVAVNVISNERFGSVRLDLTADRLYTLSDGTRSVLAKIEEPITLRFYVSERLGREIPSYATFASRIREMLQEYQSAARGKIRLEVIDPRPFTDDEDRAVAAGLQGVPVNQSGEQVYFGLVGLNAADKEEIIAFFQTERERFLEYDVTKLVYNLATPKKRTLGLLAGLPMQGEFRGMRAPPSEPWVVYTQMQQFFDIKPIEATAKEIPADIGVLMIVHPRDLPEPMLYAIDQFVLRGGRVLAMVDPHAEGEMTRPGPAAQTGQTASGLKRLFDAWGVELVEARFAGDRLGARRVNAGTESRVRAVDYVAWVTLRDAALNKSDVVMADVASLQIGSAGVLRKKDGGSTEFTWLARTSAESQEIEVDLIKMQPDPVALLANFKSSGQPLTVAARLRGPVKTAFPDGPPVEKKDDDKKDEEKKEGETPAAAPAPPAEAAKPPIPASHLDASKEAVNIVVIADTDMLEDRFWAQVSDFFGQRVAIPVANNGEFIVNVLDNLSGSNDLLALRGRGLSQRPFTRVQAIQRDAELAFRAKERELTEKVRDTEKKLAELQTQAGPEAGAAAGRSILTREQQEAIDQFRAELLSTRKELRDVQQNLRRDIEVLETRVKFANIALIPILVGIVAVVIGFARLRRRRPARRAATAAMG